MTSHSIEGLSDGGLTSAQGKLLAEALADVLVAAGVVKAVPMTGPELLNAAGEFCRFREAGALSAAPERVEGGGMEDSSSGSPSPAASAKSSGEGSGLSHENRMLIGRIVGAAINGDVPAVSADMLNAMLDAARAQGGRAQADRDRLLRHIDEVAGWVRPPLVRSEAGLHSGSERLMVIKSHRWKSFLARIAPIRDRATASASPPIGAEGGRDGLAGDSGCGEGTQEPSPSGARRSDGRGG